MINMQHLAEQLQAPFFKSCLWSKITFRVLNSQPSQTVDTYF